MQMLKRVVFIYNKARGSPQGNAILFVINPSVRRLLQPERAGSALSDKLAPSSCADCHFSSVGIHHLRYKALELVPHTDTHAYAGPVNVLRIKAPSEGGYDKTQANRKGPRVLVVPCCLVTSLYLGKACGCKGLNCLSKSVC